MSPHWRQKHTEPSPVRPAPGVGFRRTMAQSAQVKVTNAELATVREAMRELPRLLAELDAGTIEKLVLTQRNQMRAVLVTVERYSELEEHSF
jgi:hypothetical protein